MADLGLSVQSLYVPSWVSSGYSGLIPNIYILIAYGCQHECELMLDFCATHAVER